MTDNALISTGVPGLDAILTGGIGRGKLIFLVGAPGAGKTVLASQILFHAAAQGRQTLIFTTYSEGQTKLLQHLQPFAFFHQELVSNTIKVFTFPALADSDTTSASATLMRTVRDEAAELVLIDGFQGVEPMLSEPNAARSFLMGISSRLAYLNVTLLVTLTGDARAHEQSSLFTTADMLLGLTFGVAEARHVRMLEVTKQRGRAQLPGLHAYQIDRSGVTVFPRLEVYPPPQTPQPRTERASFGVSEIDAMMGGGPTVGTMTVLAGAMGTGKTLLALHWALQGVEPSAPTVIISLREHPAQLLNKAAAFGLDLAAAQRSGAVHLLRVAPVELDVDALASKILATFAFDPRRYVIDDIDPLLRALGPRAHGYLAALAELFYGANITSLVALDIPPFTGFQLDREHLPLSACAENVILLQQQERRGRLHRILGVVRMRLSAYDPSLRELVIDSEGMRLVPLPEA